MQMNSEERKCFVCGNSVTEYNPEYELSFCGMQCMLAYWNQLHREYGTRCDRIDAKSTHPLTGKELRELRGEMSIKDFAVKVKFSPSTIKKYEQSKFLTLRASNQIINKLEGRK